MLGDRRFAFHSDCSDLTSSLQRLSHQPLQAVDPILSKHLRDMYSKETNSLFHRSMNLKVAGCLVYETDSGVGFGRRLAMGFWLLVSPMAALVLVSPLPLVRITLTHQC